MPWLAPRTGLGPQRQTPWVLQLLSGIESTDDRPALPINPPGNGGTGGKETAAGGFTGEHGGDLSCEILIRLNRNATYTVARPF